MKLNKICSALLISACISLSASAENIQVTPSVVQKSPQQTIQNKKNPDLKRFNAAVNIKYLGYQHKKDEKGNSVIEFVYLIENISKINIRSVHWATTYLYNQEVILTHDLPVSFSKQLVRNTATEIAFAVPLENLPSKAKELFSHASPQIMAAQQPRNIIFSNGSKITVK